jgi:hypothetical protein
MVWYRDNNHPFVAMQIAEYGITYCQYSYSLPRVITELIHLYMLINYAEFFSALGFPPRFYDPSKNKFEPTAISAEIARIQDRWREKYPRMDFKVQNLKYDSLVNFDLSFTNELEFLNMEGK